jgi:hypothetical protein
MITQKSGCIECGMPCLYQACRHYKVDVYICDMCGEEVDKLYNYDDKQACADCILKDLGEVTDD